MSEERFEAHRGMLEPLMDMIASLGRLPESDEFPGTGEIEAAFGSLKRAFALIRRVTGSEPWEAIRQRKSEDLLVYVALGKFRRRPAISKLPMDLQRDIRAFFGTYKHACEVADALLFQAGDGDAIDAACKGSAIGKLLPNALYIHKTALDHLSPLLRVFEGCARAFIGDVPDITLIKLHRFSGKVSYLAYPDFDTDPHPALMRGVKVALRSREVFSYDYMESDNPPILHRKETFVHTEYPMYAKFARLTEQEEKQGLLDDASSIGTRQGWERRLTELNFQLRGHRLMKRKTAVGK
jgi:DNA phosphorothioation-associated putative methyltransferase